MTLQYGWPTKLTWIYGGRQSVWQPSPNSHIQGNAVLWWEGGGGCGVRLDDAREGMTRGWNGAGDLLCDVGENLRSLIWHPFTLLLRRTRTDEVSEMTVLSKPEKHLNHGSPNRGPRSAATDVNYVYTIKIAQYFRPSDITLIAIISRVAGEATITNVVLCHKTLKTHCLNDIQNSVYTSQTTQSVAITKSDMLILLTETKGTKHRHADMRRWTWRWQGHAYRKARVCKAHRPKNTASLRALRNKLLLLHYLNTTPFSGKVERIREKSKKKQILKKSFLWKYSFCPILYEAAMHLMGTNGSDVSLHTALHI